MKPKLLTTMRDYSWRAFLGDALAGVTVALVALPLSVAIGMPLFSALVGTALGQMLGLSIGGTAVLATLAASASYIAVPAAMRISVPEANPALSLAASLGVSFPFNILVGIPLYHAIAVRAHALLSG